MHAELEAMRCRPPSGGPPGYRCDPGAQDRGRGPTARRGGAHSSSPHSPRGGTLEHRLEPPRGYTEQLLEAQPPGEQPRQEAYQGESSSPSLAVPLEPGTDGDLLLNWAQRRLSRKVTVSPPVGSTRDSSPQGYARSAPGFEASQVSAQPSSTTEPNPDPSPEMNSHPLC